MDKKEEYLTASHGYEAGKKPKRKLKAGTVITAGVLVLLILGTAMYWYVQKTRFIATDDAFISAYKLNVSAQIMRRVMVLYADEGDAVRNGELLVALDSSDIKVKLNQVITALNVAYLETKLAQEKLKQAQIDLQRAKYQFKKKMISREKYDNILKAFQTAKMRCEMAKNKVVTLKMQVQVVKTDLAHTRLYSNISGVIAKRWVMQGDVVAPGQSIFTIYNLKNIWVTAMLKETDLNKISLGDTVNIRVDAYSRTKFIGRIFQIGSNTAGIFSLIPPNNASGNFTKVTQRIPIKISINPVSKAKSKCSLLPGMSVEIKMRNKGVERNTVW